MRERNDSCLCVTSLPAEANTHLWQHKATGSSHKHTLSVIRRHFHSSTRKVHFQQNTPWKLRYFTVCCRQRAKVLLLLIFAPSLVLQSFWAICSRRSWRVSLACGMSSHKQHRGSSLSSRLASRRLSRGHEVEDADCFKFHLVLVQRDRLPSVGEARSHTPWPPTPHPATAEWLSSSLSGGFK